MLVLTALGLVCGCWAQPVENWSGVDAEVLQTRRFLLRLRGEARSSVSAKSMLQARAGSDLRWMAAEHLTLIGMYQAIEVNNATKGWQHVNRVYAALDLPFQTRFGLFNSRTAVERYYQPENRHYDRYRQMIRFRWTRLRLQPAAYEETMFDSHGWAVFRPSGGVMVPVHPNIDLETGYHYEFRPARLGGDRQIVFAYFRVHRSR